MPTGIETSPELVAEFRAHYLYSGNASESARKVGLNDRTGRQIAQQLVDDPEFAEERRRLRASALEELTAMRLRVARKSLSRFEAKAPEPLVGKAGEIPVPDRRADFGRLVLEAEKNAHALAKIESGNGDADAIPAEVTIRIVKAKPPEEDDGGKAA